MQEERQKGGRSSNSRFNSQRDRGRNARFRGLSQQVVCHQVSDSVDSRPYRRASRSSRKNTGLENPLTDLLSSKITDYYFLIRSLSLLPPFLLLSSFYYHSSFTSQLEFVIVSRDGCDITFEVYFICNAKKKLTSVLIFFGYSASKLSFIVIQSKFAEFFSSREVFQFQTGKQQCRKIVNITAYNLQKK